MTPPPKYLFTFLVVLNLSTSSPGGSDVMRNLVLPDIPTEVYAQLGDINIGGTMDIHEYSNEFGCIGEIRSGTWAIEYTEAVAFAVNMVNKNPTLMPQATLGFYLLDDCNSRRYALAHALTFQPRNELVCTTDPCNITTSSNLTCCSNTCSKTSPSNGPSLSSPQTEQPVPYYDVVGVLSPLSSSLTIPMSFFLSQAKMPIVGALPTTEELSDKALHPSFVSVVTSDRYEAHAMLQFIVANRWSYISVVYSQGEYGESAFAHIKLLTGSYKICIATSHRVKDTDDMAPVAIDLLHHPRARVVILFTYEIPTLNLFKSIKNLSEIGRFIWICSDALKLAGRGILNHYMSNVVGAFLFGPNTVHVPEFYNHIRRQNARTSPNPWFKLAWENTFNCSFARGTCNARDDIISNAHFGFEGQPSLLMDAVLLIAHAIHNLLTDLCPGAKGKAARDCIKRDILLSYLFKASFKGYTGHIKFDNDREHLGKIRIEQMVFDYLKVPGKYGEPKMTNKMGLVYKPVAYYDTALDILSYTNETISWDHLLDVERIVFLTVNARNPDAPESACSKSCLPGEFKIQKDLACCWECRRCRGNEKLIKGNTECEACKKFTWPDPKTNFTTCHDIPLSYLIATETIPIIQISLAIFGSIGTLLVTATYICHCQAHVIKAAGRVLSAMQLIGMLVGYAAVILFHIPPMPVMCTALYFMFCLSFSLLYSPLFIMAIRIYSIFQSKKKGKKPRFISPLSQTIMSFMLIAIQAILCFAMYILVRPTAAKHQPVLTKKFVEFSCDMTIPGLASFLVYNFVLVSLCGVLAFKTRNQTPSNFNESRFISMCVYTTLVIWLAFIPTYFTANREFVKVLLLSSSLLVNHTVALIFLFVPKIYATLYVSDEFFITEESSTGQTKMNAAARQTSYVDAWENALDKDAMTSKLQISEAWIGNDPNASCSLNQHVAGNAPVSKASNMVEALSQPSFYHRASIFITAVTAPSQLPIWEKPTSPAQMESPESPSVPGKPLDHATDLPENHAEM